MWEKICLPKYIGQQYDPPKSRKWKGTFYSSEFENLYNIFRKNHWKSYDDKFCVWVKKDNDKLQHLHLVWSWRNNDTSEVDWENAPRYGVGAIINVLDGKIRYKLHEYVDDTDYPNVVVHENYKTKWYELSTQNINSIREALKRFKVLDNVW